MMISASNLQQKSLCGVQSLDRCCRNARLLLGNCRSQQHRVQHLNGHTADFRSSGSSNSSRCVCVGTGDSLGLKYQSDQLQRLVSSGSGGCVDVSVFLSCCCCCSVCVCVTAGCFLNQPHLSHTHKHLCLDTCCAADGWCRAVLSLNQSVATHQQTSSPFLKTPADSAITMQRCMLMRRWTCAIASGATGPSCWTF